MGTNGLRIASSSRTISVFTLQMQSPLTLLHFEFCVPRLSHVSVHVLSMIDKKQLKLNEKKLNVILDSLFHYRAPYHIETSPFICSSNQCTGFYVIDRHLRHGRVNKFLWNAKLGENGLTRFSSTIYSKICPRLTSVVVELCLVGTWRKFNVDKTFNLRTELRVIGLYKVSVKDPEGALMTS